MDTLQANNQEGKRYEVKIRLVKVYTTIAKNEEEAADHIRATMEEPAMEILSVKEV